MSWRAITENEVLASMHSAEATAFSTALLASGQSDPMDEVIGLVTEEVREAIRTWPKNTLSPTETHLPAGAIGHAVVIIRHKLLTRFSDSRETSEARLMEYREARKYLDLVAQGKRAVEGYGDEPDAKAPVAGPSISEPSPNFGRASQDGI